MTPRQFLERFVRPTYQELVAADNALSEASYQKQPSSLLKKGFAPYQ